MQRPTLPIWQNREFNLSGNVLEANFIAVHAMVLCGQIEFVHSRQTLQ